MLYDYYDQEEFDKVFDEFFLSVEKYGENTPFHDAYLSYLQIPQDVKEKYSLDYEVDSDAYLFFLVRFFGLKSPAQRRQLLKHPYIKSLNIEDEISHLHTTFGDIDFKYFVKGIPDIFKKTFQNYGYSPLIESFRLFRDEYIGAYNGRCHEASLQFCGPNNVVTAFMCEPLSGLRYLHSFVESDERVLEASANIVMDKEDYYRLSRPEVVTKIPGEELFEIWNTLFQEYPRLKEMSIKQLLVEYDEVLKNPDTVKVKTFKK